MKSLEDAFAQFPQMSNNFWVTTSLQRIIDAVSELAKAVHYESCEYCQKELEETTTDCWNWQKIIERIAVTAFREGQREGERIKKLQKGN